MVFLEPGLQRITELVFQDLVLASQIWISLGADKTSKGSTDKILLILNTFFE